ncbi:uncharacterized protein LOC143573921 [Bidens hawaiensis]|uniref:uncharacterized protein LOC143573921 n=1 Tax=Bidens hawaiensis TaxID=980011 RepID=UPI004049BEB1
MDGMMGWKVAEDGWRKGSWTPTEDKLLMEYVALHGEGRWSSVHICSGLKRSGKSCRLRWVNYLRPGLKKGRLSPQEEGIIIELHALWGNKWSTIATYLPGRTDNEIKNYWRTHFKKKGKPFQNDKKRKYEAQFGYNQVQQVQGMVNYCTSSESEVYTPRSTMHESVAITSSTDKQLQQQQNQCMIARDVATWWDTISEDDFWKDLMWKLDHDYPNQAMIEQSFSPCLTDSI